MINSMEEIVPRLHEPKFRAEVALAVLLASGPSIMILFGGLMAVAPTTPSPERIRDRNDKTRCKWTEVRDPSGVGVAYAYFEGIGSMLVHAGPKGVDVWVDALPGAGSDARRSYLEFSVNMSLSDLPNVTIHGEGTPIDLATAN